MPRSLLAFFVLSISAVVPGCKSSGHAVEGYGGNCDIDIRPVADVTLAYKVVEVDGGFDVTFKNDSTKDVLIQKRNGGDLLGKVPATQSFVVKFRSTPSYALEFKYGAATVPLSKADGWQGTYVKANYDQTFSVRRDVAETSNISFTVNRITVEFRAMVD